MVLVLRFAILLIAGCASAEADLPLFEGLGHHHHEITTSSAEAQAYFDQGLRLTYGFNHEEAIRSFQQALAYDEGCTMCWWGIALAAGPNINAAMEEEAEVVAWRAVEHAMARVDEVSEKEGAYIRAIAARYGPEPMVDRAARDSAYAMAMADVVAAYPADDDAQVLYADALMNLSPWHYWTEEARPRPGTEELLTALTTVVERNPDHAGACHLYIHAVEKTYPERAVACAERLPSLMPSAGHIVHMPAHIFIRVGRYADAVDINHAAAHADERYIHAESPRGIYPVAYYPHNYDFLAFAAAMAGRRTEALEAARRGAALVDVEMMRVPGLGGLQNYLVLPLRMMLRFGMWEEVLVEPAPDTGLDFVVGFTHYARGMALLRTGRADEAREAVAALRDRITSPDIEPYVIWWNPARDVLTLGVLALEAEILLEEGDAEAALDTMARAVDLEDALVYDEPPPWSIPGRQVLGRMLLELERFGEAEGVFRADLEQYPENGWSLWGLASALNAQGREVEAAEVNQRFEAAWATADVEPALR
jgi:tetratricopeptide (TPR) repeat protein